LLTPPPPPRSTLFPYTTLFRSVYGEQLRQAPCAEPAGRCLSKKITMSLFLYARVQQQQCQHFLDQLPASVQPDRRHSEAFLVNLDRKSTRLNSSHRTISYAVFC